MQPGGLAQTLTHRAKNQLLTLQTTIGALQISIDALASVPPPASFTNGTTSQSTPANRPKLVAAHTPAPLARLQMATGILAERAPAELHPTVADVREEVQQMSTLVNELLAFTKAGLQRREVVLTRVALAPMVQAVIARLAPVQGVEEVRITDEDEYFPPPRELRDLLTAIDVLATFSLGGSVPDRPQLRDRDIAASDVLAQLTP